MTQKLLTISIAAYNVENKIQKALDSLIIDNDYFDLLDIIVVNDGSTDRTKEIANHYCEKYPGVITLIDKANGGYGSTVNCALMIAKGKYFKLLDGDDWFETKNLSSFLEFLSTATADIVITPYYYVNDKCGYNLVNINENINSFSEKISQCDFRRNVVMHEMAVKTELLRKNHVQLTEHCLYTDNEFTFLSFIYSNSISRFNDPIYCYQLGADGQSVSRDSLSSHRQDLIKVSMALFSYYSMWNDKNNISKKKLLDWKLISIVEEIYKTFLLLKQPASHKEELREYDQWIKSHYHDGYLLTNSINKVRFLRKTHFLCFRLSCFLYSVLRCLRNDRS